mgnify:CR=1 FL=1
MGITLVPMLTAWRARLGEPRKRARAGCAASRARRSARCANYLRALGGNFRVGIVRRASVAREPRPGSRRAGAQRLGAGIARAGCCVS